MEKGYQALFDVMEQHLSSSSFFVGGVYSIADVALFAYTHVAEEGGFSLKDYPHIRHWIDRGRTRRFHPSGVENTSLFVFTCFCPSFFG